MSERSKFHSNSNATVEHIGSEMDYNDVDYLSNELEQQNLEILGNEKGSVHKMEDIYPGKMGNPKSHENRVMYTGKKTLYLR